jgi:phosphopantetheinyl transferase
MPLIREWEPDAQSLAAIWRMDEPEDFFTATTGLESAIKSDKRRIERLAGRYLLQHLKADFPLHHIAADGHDKPRIPGNQYYFSISHSYPYVAAMLSDRQECGLDIQVWHPRMEALQNKFLSIDEQAFFNNDHRLITLAWGAKEAAYKWLGRRGIDFIDQLPIKEFSAHSNQYHFLIHIRVDGSSWKLRLSGTLSNEYALATTVM